MRMLCRRCRGLMVRDQFTDFLDDTGKMRFKGWRCIVCGEIVDAVIFFNRLSPVLYKRRARRYLKTQLSR